MSKVKLLQHCSKIISRCEKSDSLNSAYYTPAVFMCFGFSGHLLWPAVLEKLPVPFFFSDQLRIFFFLSQLVNGILLSQVMA